MLNWQNKERASRSANFQSKEPMAGSELPVEPVRKGCSGTPTDSTLIEYKVRVVLSMICLDIANMATITSLPSVNKTMFSIVPRSVPREDGSYLTVDEVWRAVETTYGNELKRVKTGRSLMKPDHKLGTYSSDDGSEWRYLGCIQTSSDIESEEFKSALAKIHEKHPNFS